MIKNIIVAATVAILTLNNLVIANNNKHHPGLAVTSFNSNSIEIDWKIKNLQINNSLIDNIDYTTVKFDECNYSENIGKPDLPYREFILGIPEGATVTYSISNISFKSVNDVLPIPVGSPFKEKSGITSIYRIPDFSNYNFLPKNIIEISEPQYFREMLIVRVRYYPVNYNHANKSLKIIESAKITFSFIGGNTNGTHKLTKPNHLYRALALNYEQAKNWLTLKPVSFRKITFDGLGPWYKIEITKDGLYKISTAVLSAVGIDVSSLDPRTIKIYNNGGRSLYTNSLSLVNNPHEPVENAIYVQGESDGSFGADDYILFYGTQLGGWNFSSSQKNFVFEQHPYDTKNYYWLTFGGSNGKRMHTESAPNSASTSTDSCFWERIHFEDETHNLLSSGNDWYGRRFSGRSGQESFNYSLHNVSSGSHPAKFRIKFKGGSDIFYTINDPNTYKYEFTVYLNAANNPQSIITSIFTSGISREDEFLFTSTDFLLNGSNSVKIDYAANLENCSAYLDWIEFYYPHDFVASNNFLSFYTNIIGQVIGYNISGFTNSDIKLFDITDPVNVRFLTTNPVQSGSLSFKLDLSNNENKRLIAASLASPAVNNISSISKYTPAKNLFDQTMQTDLIIISPPSFQSYAEEIINLRKSGEYPIDGAVFTTDDIFFYFGSGVKDPVAIRNFIRHAYNNWTPKPQYVLLFGDGHYDYRNISISDTNFVPPYEITNNHEIDSRETDNFYTAIHGSSLGSIVPEIPIGRLPVESYLDARNIVDKLIAYQNDKSHDGWQTVLTFVGDDQVPRDEWIHQKNADLLATLPVLNKFIKNKIYLTAYNSVPGGFGRVKPEANQAIIDQLNEGTLIMNYVGHGASQVWAHENVFEMNRDLNRIQNEGKLTLFIAATCTFGKYDNPRDVSFTEALIWRENAGAIGVVAASRGVYSSANQSFNISFYNKLFPGGGYSRTIGEAFLLASLPGTINYQKFHLFGDPSMYLADPRQTVKISSIEPATLKALSKVSITGIIKKDSTDWKDFNGGASVIVNDAKFENVNTGNKLNYSLNGPRLFKGEISVDNGVFGVQKPTEFIVPKSIRYQNKNTGRMTIYAWNENGYGDAMGFVDTLLFYGTEILSDQDGPQIDIYFEGQKYFNNGGIVSKNPTLIAEIYDENGINLTHEVGHVIEIQIDDNPVKDITSFFAYNRDSYSEGELKYNIEDLTPGLHQLKIKAWDNLNNPTTETINFEAITQDGITLKKVVNYPNPFQYETEFTFHSLGSEGADLIIKVYTISGRLIKTIEGRVIDREGFNHIPWDGRDEDGDLIANGVYPYKIILKKDNDHKEVIEKLVKLK